MVPKTQVYAIANRKGGVGKTTTAVSLAAGLAKKLDGNGHVVIVDLDAQGNVAPMLGIELDEGQLTLADLLTGKAPIEKVVIGGGRNNLWFIPANDKLAEAKEELMESQALAVLRAFRKREKAEPSLAGIFVEKLGRLRTNFDYIILDCPPSLDSFSDAVYQFAEAVIVPVKPDYVSGIGTAAHTRNIAEAQVKLGSDVRIECLLPTFFRKRERLARFILEDLTRHYGVSKVAEPIPQAVVLEQAPAAGGQTIFEYAPDSPAAAAYWDLVDRILGDYKPEEEVFYDQENV